MKKYLKFLMLLPFAALLAACNLGDSEPVGKYAFETDSQQILIEAKLPSGAYAEDEIYICGPFNGAEVESYVEDAKWRLTQSSININIFGIYLDPTTFVEGTSLADGFWFYSKNSGLSLTTKKEFATYTSSADVGQRTSVVVSQWGEPVKDEVETLPEHDGYRVYVEDRAEWGAFALYAWGDAEFFGGWPGMQPTGTETISGVEYTYFEFTDAEGLNLNLIINNNNGGTQTDNINITFGEQKDFFYAVTGTGNPASHEVIENPIKPIEKLPEHEAFRVYVDNYAGWEGMALYAWGDEEFFGGWPGAQPTGTETIGGVEYTYFEFDATGLNLNLIINNNNGGTQTDNINITFGEQMDFFYVVTGTGNPCTFEVIEDPFNRQPIGGGEDEGGEDPETPEEPETPAAPVYLYVNDQTGWTTFAHYWNAGGFTTQWPGVNVGTAESKSLSGVAYKYFQVDPAAGAAVSVIFSNDGSDAERLQKDLTTDQTRYYTLTATELTEDQPKARIYVEDKTGWDAIAAYSWSGDTKIFGDWPGAQPAGTETVGGKEYKYFEVAFEHLGLKANIIFNNNGAGTQIEGKPAQVDLVLDQDYFYVVTADDAVFAE